MSNASQTVAQLLKPHLSSEMCVRFWWVTSCMGLYWFQLISMRFSLFHVLLCMFRYWFPAGSSNSLSVHLLWGEELTDALWHRSGTPSSDWEVAEVTVSSPVKFYVSHFSRSLIKHFSIIASFKSILYSFVIPVRLLPKTQFMSFTRWCFRRSMGQTLILQWN